MKKLNEPNSVFCPLPWKHLSIEANTLNFKLCCVSEFSLADESNNFNLLQKTTTTVFQSQTLKDIRKNMLCGKANKKCTACYSEESVGAFSMRQFYLDAYPHDWDHLSQNAPKDGSWDQPVTHLELRLGNLCNLKCIMCHPSSSSSFTDYKLIYDQDTDVINNHDSSKLLEENNFDFMISQLQNLEAITFRGGEPLINPAHFKILELLKSTGQSSAISLSYTTNLTQLPDRLLDLWKKFKSVEIWVSVDGTDEVNHFIRFPSSWNVLTKNLEKLDKWAQEAPDLNWGVVTTAQAYNVMYIDEVFNLVKPYSTAYKTPFINHLQNPKVLSFGNLSQNLIEISIERLRKALINYTSDQKTISARDQKIRFIKRHAEKELACIKRLENLIYLLEKCRIEASQTTSQDLKYLTEKIALVRKISIPTKISSLF